MKSYPHFTECNLSLADSNTRYHLVAKIDNLILMIDSSEQGNITSFFAYPDLNVEITKVRFSTEFIPFDQIKSYISNIDLDTLCIFQ